MNAVWALLIAAAWGFAEATLFFLVPDVVLSAVAIADWRLALWCCLAATAGALAGGVVMYVAGRRDDDGLRALFLRIPGIGPAMLERVTQQVASRGFLAVLLGPLYDTPYKLYATEAGRRRLSLPVLMLVTIPARLLRFLAVNRGRVMSKGQIVDHVWEYDFDGNYGIVETYVSYLRKKLGDTDGSLIQTVRGFGYVIRNRE